MDDCFQRFHTARVRLGPHDHVRCKAAYPLRPVARSCRWHFGLVPNPDSRGGMRSDGAHAGYRRWSLRRCRGQHPRKSWCKPVRADAWRRCALVEPDALSVPGTLGHLRIPSRPPLAYCRYNSERSLSRVTRRLVQRPATGLPYRNCRKTATVVDGTRRPREKSGNKLEARMAMTTSSTDEVAYLTRKVEELSEELSQARCELGEPVSSRPPPARSCG
jgi:hypothetical protein